MQNTVELSGRYQLKSIHEEIGLCDRKLAHMEKFETYASDEARASAIAKMTTKRAKLAKTAQNMASAGVEYLPSELPASLRPAEKSTAAISA